MTWCGAAAIILIWVSSEIIYCSINCDLGRFSIGGMSVHSNCGLGYGIFRPRKPDFHVRYEWAYKFGPGFSRLFPQIMSRSILIPYWMILAGFLSIQYLLLPKSLPVTEESDRTDP